MKFLGWGKGAESHLDWVKHLIQQHPALEYQHIPKPLLRFTHVHQSDSRVKFQIDQRWDTVEKREKVFLESFEQYLKIPVNKS